MIDYQQLNERSLVKNNQRQSSKYLKISGLCFTLVLTLALMLPAATGISASAQACSSNVSKDAAQWAVVNVSDCFLRAEPRYGSECVSQSRMGTLVQVLERKGYWVKVATPEPYEGWINELALAPVRELSVEEQKATGLFGATLSPMDQAAAEMYLRAPTQICVSRNATVYAGPDSDEPLTTLLMSDIVRVPKGFRINNTGRRCIVLPDGREGWVSQKALKDMHFWAYGEAAESDSVKIAGILALAKSFLGVPYLWGGMSAGHFDCSGLTGFCYFMNGILLPRDASQQVRCGIEVPLDAMQPGDLVFFGNTSVGHVALYLGGGRIIHASQLVRINSLVPGEKDYYGRNILHVRRIIGHLQAGELKAVYTKDSPAYF